jgi:membrane fusion protein (multidrug efflux system)
MKEKLLVYSGVLLLAGVLVAGAQLYAKNSQESQERKRRESTQNAADDAKRQTPVKVCAVFTQPFSDVLLLPGTVEAYDDIDLAAKMPGTIEWIGPREGDKVGKGEKILQMDVAAAQARLTQAKVAVELAQLKFARQQQLYDQKVSPVDQLDDARSALKNAEAALEAAQVAVNNGLLYSPIDGTVDRLYVDAAEHLGEGQTVMKIVDIERVKAVLNIPEKDILYFKRGQSVSLEFSNGQRHTFTGTIDSVALTAERSARTYPVKVAVDNADKLLRPGMIVRASLTRRSLDKAIAVPFFLIIDREKNRVVYVVENGVARERVVQTGIIQGGQVEIVSGLKEGDMLVVVGHRNLFDGEPVMIAGDVTELARRFVEEKRDLSSLPLELLR